MGQGEHDSEVLEAREIFVGIVRPVGIDGKALRTAIEQSLATFGYDVELVRLSDSLPQQKGEPYDDRTEHLIEAGNKICREKKTGEAVLQLGIEKLRKTREKREEAGKAPTLGRRAVIFDSLKRPAEVNLLKNVYGPWFVLIGAQADLDNRLGYLRAQIQRSRTVWSDDQIDTRASDLVRLDRHEDDQYGQDVLNTFPKADVFLDLSGRRSLNDQVDRFFSVIFGLRVAPSDEEQGMAAAFLASHRSTSSARRVGAALTKGEKQASLIAVGMNEVAKPSGGHPEDVSVRDPHYTIGDYNKSRIRKILASTLEGLAKGKLINADVVKRIEKDASLEALIDELLEGPLKDSPIRHLIEFYKSVHAEMSAILDAARRGVPTQDLTLYSTTYPCHLCAKEIVAAGIAEVIYIEPYPKSLAQAMYDDQISESAEDKETRRIPFRPFVGISPTRFGELLASQPWTMPATSDVDRKKLIPKLGGELPQNTTLLEREEEAVRRTQ
jgi:cytidine deaminase